MAYEKLIENLPIYKTNPSLEIVESSIVKKRTRVKFRNNNKALIDASTGEFAGELQNVFVTDEEVDKEQFIKIYANQINILLDLSPAGIKVLKLIYTEMLNNHNKDTLSLSYTALKELGSWQWSKPTFTSGLNELLKHQVIYKSVHPFQYFVNLQMFYNGDRILTINRYRLKKQDDLFNNQFLKNENE